MKKINIIFCFAIFICLFFILGNNAYAIVGNSTIEQQQQALYNTAYAFYYRGKNIQYDAQPLTYKSRTYLIRDDLFYTPEEAVGNYEYYTFCSTFVWKIYANAFTDISSNEPLDIAKYIKYDLRFRNRNLQFGNVLPYDYTESANPQNGDYYKDEIAQYYKEIKADTLSDSQKEEIVNDIKNIVQPGDIISYYILGERLGGSGHSIMYLGDNKIIQSYFDSLMGGGVYDFENLRDKVELNGTINIQDLDERLITYVSEANKRHDKNNQPQITRFSVIRPLNYINASNTICISDNAKGRSLLPKLIIEKTADKSKYTTVSKGDTIKYTIKVTNKSQSEHYNIRISDVIPEGTTLVDAKDSVSDGLGSGYSFKQTGNKIEWTYNSSTGSFLPAGNYRTFWYIVRVDTQETKSGEIVCDGGEIIPSESNYSIKLNAIHTPIGYSLSEEKQSSLQETINIIPSNKTYTNAQAFIKDVYSSIGYNVSFQDMSTEINRIFDTNGKVNTDELYNSGYQTAKGHYQDSGEGFNQKTVYCLKNNLTNDDMYVDGLYGGGYTIKDNISEYEDKIRTRNVKYEDFTIGDVLIINDDGVTPKNLINIAPQNFYIYCGDGVFKTVNSSGKIETINMGTSIDSNMDEITLNFSGYTADFKVTKDNNVESYSTDFEEVGNPAQSYRYVKLPSITPKDNNASTAWYSIVWDENGDVIKDPNGNDFYRYLEKPGKQKSIYRDSLYGFVDKVLIARSEKRTERFLETLFAKENFVVLRPSLANANYSVNGQYYGTLEEAYNAITGMSGTIEVEKNVTDYSDFSVEAGKTITINLNEREIVKMATPINNGGTLIINGSGEIGTCEDASSNQIQYLIINSGDLLISGSTIQHRGMTNTATAVISSTDGNVSLTDGAVVEIIAGTGANTTKTNIAIVMLEDANVTIDNSVVSNTVSGQAIVGWNGSGTLTIKNESSISSKSTSIYFYGENEETNSVDVVVQGGTIISQNGMVLNMSSTNGGFSTGSALITGGTLKTLGNSSAIYAPNQAVTIGTNDGTVSTTVPEIVGVNGIGTVGTLNYFDGIIKGSSQAIIGGVSSKPDNYNVINGKEIIEGKQYKIAILSDRLKGDVNNDGKVDIVDVRLLLQSLINNSYSKDEIIFLDFNDDCEISILDVRTLLQFIINQ